MRFPLRYRVAVLTVVCIAPVVGASSAALLRMARSYLWKEARTDVVAFARTVRGATRHAMLAFDRPGVSAILETVAREQGVRSVRLYDGRGRLRLPEGLSEPSLDPAGPRCSACHAGPRDLRLPEGGCVQRVGGVLRLYYPIPAEPSCVSSYCHGPEEAQLGFLEVERDLEPVLRHLDILASQALIWSLVVLVAAVLPLFLAYNWAFQRPLAECLRLVGEVARGNLAESSRLIRFDEWGDLLRALEAMMGRLRATRADLEALNRDLEAQVTARTRELEQALGEARTSDRMKTEFLAGISHELSTPLQGVIGYAELLLDGIEGELRDEQRRDVEVIRRNGLRLLDLVEDLLELARIEGGNRLLCIDSVRLEDLAEAAVEHGRHLAAGKSIEVSLDLDGSRPPILADARALRHVLFHLVENAVRCTERGEVQVALRPPRAGRVEVAVTDSGVGMPADVIGRALEGFLPKGGGGGLAVGLALSRRLVELHGGELILDSEPGRGTQARVLLPLREEGAAPR